MKSKVIWTYPDGARGSFGATLPRAFMKARRKRRKPPGKRTLKSWRNDTSIRQLFEHRGLRGFLHGCPHSANNTDLLQPQYQGTDGKGRTRAGSSGLRVARGGRGAEAPPPPRARKEWVDYLQRVGPFLLPYYCCHRDDGVAGDDQSCELPCSLRLFSQVKAGDVIVKVGSVNIQNQPLSNLRDLILGEPGTYVVLGFNRGSQVLLLILSMLNAWLSLWMASLVSSYASHLKRCTECMYAHPRGRFKTNPWGQQKNPGPQGQSPGSVSVSVCRDFVDFVGRGREKNCAERKGNTSSARRLRGTSACSAPLGCAHAATAK